MEARGRLVAAVTVPWLLIAGAVAAEALQPAGFDPLQATLSDVAGLDAAHREVMTGVIIGMGAWFLVTARWLTVVGMAGRVLLGAGGFGCLLIATAPVSKQVVPVRHLAFAALAFLALSLWPVAGMRRSPGSPWPLRPVVATTVSLVLCGLFAWFTVSVALVSWMGLPEHILAVILVTWPSVVLIGSGDRRSPRHDGDDPTRRAMNGSRPELVR